MKIIKRWYDERYKAENILYKLPNGTRFIHTVDAKTVDSVYSIKTHMGSLYNDIINVRNGTAHFLEHILAGNPNEVFKTKKQIDSFEFGTKKYPRIYSNAFTARKFVTFHGTTNSEGEYRLLKRVNSILKFNQTQFSKFIEKERKIILAEIGEKEKPEKDGILQYFSFAFKNLPNDYKKYTLGNEDDVKSITVKDLGTFYNHLFNPNKVILTLQSNSEKLSKKTIKELLNADSLISGFSTNAPSIPDENLKNTFMYSHFHDDKARNIVIEMNSYTRKESKINYRQRASRILASHLIGHLIFEELREKKGYIYSSESWYNSSLLQHYNIRGCAISTSLDNFKRAVDAYQNILESGAKMYLNSKTGKKWLEGQISQVLYPNTVNYDEEYAISIASNVIEDADVLDYAMLKEEVIKIQTTDILKYIDQNILNTPQTVWITSDGEEAEIMKRFMTTKLFKQQSKLKTTEPA